MGAVGAVFNNVRSVSRGVRDFLGHIVGCRDTCCMGEDELEIYFGDVRIVPVNDSLLETGLDS